MTPIGPITGRDTFHKLEKLCSRNAFSQLMAEGKNINLFPFRLIWAKMELQTPFPVQAGFTVPKRNFKKAVHRNRIKRLMREVYRKNKDIHYPLLMESGKQAALLFIYNGNRLPDFSVTEEKIKLLLRRFVEDAKTAAE